MEQRDDVEVYDTDNVTLEYLIADFKRRRKAETNWIKQSKVRVAATVPERTVEIKRINCHPACRTG